MGNSLSSCGGLDGVTVTTDEDEDSGQESRLTGLPTVIMSIKDKGEDGDCNNGT